MNTPNAGVVESQVFTGTGAAAGLYAYAYQFGVNNVNDTSTNQPTSVNSASMLFNATPVTTNLTNTGNTSAYVITDGQVGGINLPQAAPGSVVQTPSSIAWLPGEHDRVVDFPVPEPDHGYGSARGRRHQRNGRRAFDAAVHSAVREPPESRAANDLPHGLLPDGRHDRAGAGT